MKNYDKLVSQARHEALEARLLFSGDLAPLTVAAQPLLDAAPKQAAQAIELVVLDARVENQALLLQDIATQQANGRPLVLVEVSADQDGIAIVSQAIETARASGFEISALHILSHGRDGEFDLGNQQVDQNFVRQNSSILARWSTAFSDDGDILIYGCNFAQSDVGRQLAQSISVLTGADVAANPQATGALALGGDWLLDYRTGSIESADAISVSAQNAWQQLLQITATSAPQVVGAGTGDQFTAGAFFDSASTDKDTSGGHTVAIDKDGNYAVAWSDRNSLEIKVQAYWADGTLRGAQAIVGALEFASISMNEHGEFVVAGSDRSLARNVWVQRFNADGSKNGALTNVTSGVGYFSYTPSIAINNNKDYVVTWNERLNLFSSVTSIVARGFRWDGTLIGSTSVVDIPNGSNQTRPAVALVDNTAYVVWESANGSLRHDILLRAFNIQAGTFSAVTTVNVNQTEDHLRADVSVNSSGRAVVAWQARASSQETIQYRIFGTTAFSTTPVLSASPLTPTDRDFTPLSSSLHEALPQVSVDDSGKFVITAQVKDPALGDLNIIAAQFDQLANFVGQEVVATEVDSDLSFTAGDQFGASVAVRNSRAVVSWTSVPPVSGSRVGNGYDVLVRTASVSIPQFVIGYTGLNINEGSSAFVNISLSAAPSQNITVNASVSDTTVGTVTPGALTFGPSNWNIPQQLQVSAIANHASLIDQPFILSISSDSNNPGEFATMATQTFTFTNRNLDPIHEIVVDTEADDPLDTTADTSSLLALLNNKGTDGKVSLREALLASNNTPTDSTNPKNHINFDLSAIPGNIPIIDVAVPLPDIVRPVVIDGTGTLNSYVGIRGNNTGKFNGLQVDGGLTANSGGSTSEIRRLAIGGFSAYGIGILASDVLLENNYIGLSPFGTPLLGNTIGGVLILENNAYESNSNKLISNEISNNGAAGVYIVGADATEITGNTIANNGQDPLSSGDYRSGIVIQRESRVGNAALYNSITSNTIVSNPGNGVWLYGVGVENTRIVGNNIGTNATLNVLGNGGNGIKITEGAGNTFIRGNGIANNALSGVKIVSDAITSSINNEITENLIYRNGQMAIDLALADGPTSSPTPNDTDGTDNDFGPNGLTNFPVLSRVIREGGGTRVIGAFNGFANTPYTIEVYASPIRDANLRGEQKFYRGTFTVLTDGSGVATLDNTVSGVSAIGEFVSVTATHFNLSSVYQETSEVSNAIAVEPAAYFLSAAITIPVNENSPAFQIDATSHLNGPLPPGWKFSQRPTIGGDDSTYASVDPITGIVSISPLDFEYLTSGVGGYDNEVWIYIDVTNTADVTQTDQIVYKIQVTDVNEKPSIAPRGTLTLAEDSIVQFLGADKFVLSDIDANTRNDLADLEVTVSSTNQTLIPTGTFAYTGDPSLVVSSAPSSITLRGKLSAVHTALQQLAVTPPANSTEPLVFTATLNDLGSGLGGSNQNDAKTWRVNFNPVNDSPILSPATTNSAVTALQVPYGTPIVVASNLVTSFSFSDPDLHPASHLFKLTLSTGVGSVNLPNTFGASTNTLSINLTEVTGTQAQLTQILNSFQYVPSITVQGNDTLAIQINDLDGALNSASNQVFVYLNSLSNSAPVLGSFPITLAYTEGSTPIAVAPTVTVSDTDSLILQGAIMKWNVGYLVGEDVLALSTTLPSGVTSNFNTTTGELTITGNASRADYENLLRRVTYSNTSANPGTGVRTLSISVSDGVAASAPGVVTLSVAAVNSPPVLQVPINISLPFLGTSSFSSGGFVASVTDVDDNGGIYRLRVVAQSNLGVLNLGIKAGITILSVGANQVPIISISGRLAAIDGALRSLTYTSLSGVQTNDLVSIEIAELGLAPGDPGGAPTSKFVQILIAAPISPSISGAENVVTFNEGDGPKLLFSPSLSLSLGNKPQLYSATVNIGSGYEQGADQLTAVLPAITNVQQIWDDATGTLSLIGLGSVAEYESIIRSITFTNPSQMPSQTLRQITLVTSDGVIDSATFAGSVYVVAVNDSPLISGLANVQILEDSAFGEIGTATLGLTDVDSTTLELRVTASSGALTWDKATSVPASVRKVSETEFRLQGSATEIAAWATQLRFTPTANFNGVVSLNWDLADDAAIPSHSTATTSLQVLAVNDAPDWSTTQPIAVDQGKISVLTPSVLSASDIDDPVSSLTFQLTALPQNGQLRLSGVALSLGSTFRQADIDAGRVAYQHDDSTTNSDSIRLVVKDSAGASAPELSIPINVTSRAAVYIAPPTSTTGTTSSAPSTVATTPTANTAVKDLESSGGSINSGAGSSVVPPVSVSTSNANRSSPRAATPQTGATLSISSQSSNQSYNEARRQEYAPAELERQAAASPVVNKTTLSSVDKLNNNFELLRLRTVAENSAYVDQIRKVMSDGSFANDLQKVREDIIKFDGKVIASTTAVSASLSIGYVIWLVRSGALISSLLASIPAWQLVDPMPILGSMGGGNEHDDDESLDEMIKKSRAKKQASQPIEMAALT